jgi:hypothetical protein
MGDVYQAADSKLGRNVALKILPETFAQDSAFSCGVVIIHAQQAAASGDPLNPPVQITENRMSRAT